MTYAVNTHNSWDIVKVGNYQSIEEARRVFGDRCDDLRYKSDGTVKGVVLVQGADAGAAQWLEWFAFM